MGDIPERQSSMDIETISEPSNTKKDLEHMVIMVIVISKIVLILQRKVFFDFVRKLRKAMQPCLKGKRRSEPKP